MKNSIYYLSLLFLLATSCVQENIEQPKMGLVSFSAISFTHFGGMSPNARMLEDSEWKHIFKESATLTITHKQTGAEYSLQYNPNDFTNAYQIQLPYGEYTVFSEVTGGDFEKFLPFTISGEFTLAETSLDISLQGSTDYGLVTVKKEFVLSANLDGEHELEICDQGFTLYAYVKDGLTPTLTIYENFNGQALQKELDIAAYNHYHFYLKLTEIQGTVNLIELAIGSFEYHEEFFEIGAEEEIKSVTDADGNVYKVVKIGEQYWMAENLRNTTYCDGTPLETFMPPGITMPYGFNEQPDYAFIKADRYTSENNYYYNREVARNEKNICPCNWHISTDEDWMELERYLGIPESDLYSRRRGYDQEAADQLMALDWPDIYGAVPPELNITNSTGFTAYPNGRWIYDIDETGEGLRWNAFSFTAWWWSPKEDSLKMRSIQSEGFSVSPEEVSAIYRMGSSDGARDGHILSIRCVKD
ncbi:fibrobacter succinogenes major paralogous domain-containing protein [Echinicola sp. CAU 1574]|uniref:Fibrobacter succinogenes major paralogous domain-containing protein n=1 Tax=Echinicola arenosa TaxID=2774144 RepID=A0ABR9AMC5_9BACT|nr:fibrobacter succinogenes major paralogous domain-containing protein [Echinicola arenosa]MBD8489486.1 fibrobacter succinogenes major paralogous domain-containing protein [Echinicola arenosa]